VSFPRRNADRFVNETVTGRRDSAGGDDAEEPVAVLLRSRRSHAVKEEEVVRGAGADRRHLVQRPIERDDVGRDATFASDLGAVRAEAFEQGPRRIRQGWKLSRGRP